MPGSIEPYETAKGRRYRVRYRDPDRRSREKGGFGTKRDAQEYLAGVTVASARGEYIDPQAARVTIGELGPLWLEGQTHLKPSAFRPLESAWRIHVEPKWRHRRIGEIQHSQVQAWVSELTKSRSATTVLRAFGVLAGILDVAVRDRRIQLNVARGTNLPKKRRKARNYLTHERVELLAQSVQHDDTLVRLLAYTGLRWGEATALRVRHVDFGRRRLLVEENAVNVGRDLIVGSPKSDEARSVTFPAFLVPALEHLATGKTREQILFGDGNSHMRPPDRRRGWFAGGISRARKSDPDFPVVTIHDLRHTAASLAISSGANVKAVQRMLGHASAAMTLDVYGDLFEDDLDAVSAHLDSARARALDRTQPGAA